MSGIIVSLEGQAPQAIDSVFNAERTFAAEDLIRGERLFYGLAYPGSKSINCAGCHNTRVLDTLNWNPDALTISSNYLEKTAKDLSLVLLAPRGKKMAEVHNDFQLIPEDIILIKAYMDEFVNIGLKHPKPVITNLSLFILASLLFLISFVDILITRRLKNQWINKVIIPITAFYITYVLVVNAIALGRSRNYEPDQPIKFSHAIHAGQNQTDCLYCHSGAPYSKSAGIPPLNVCMNCHFLVRNGTRSGAAEISRVVAAFENKQAVDWIKVYNLPDFVFFSHEQHVGAGEVSCQSCHGEVQDMHRLYQVPDLSMGWCLDCHDTRSVKISNEYYRSHFPELLDSMKRVGIDSVRVSLTGGRDCGNCHY